MSDLKTIPSTPNRPPRTTPLKTPSGAKSISTPRRQGITPHLANTPLFGSPSVRASDKLVKVTFEVTYKTQKKSQTMSVVGSLSTLGGWDVKRGRKMESLVPGKWILEVYIPEARNVMYKYICLDEEENTVVWESDMIKKDTTHGAPDDADCQSPVSKCDKLATPEPEMEYVKVLQQENDLLKQKLNSMSVEKQRLESANDSLQSGRAKAIESVAKGLSEDFKAVGSTPTSSKVNTSEGSQLDFFDRLPETPNHNSSFSCADESSSVQASIKALTISMVKSREKAEQMMTTTGGQPSASVSSACMSEASALVSSKLQRDLQASESARLALEKEKKDLQQLYEQTSRDIEALKEEQAAKTKIRDSERRAESAARALIESSVRVLAGQLETVKTEYRQLHALAVKSREDTLPMLGGMSQQLAMSIASVSAGIQSELDSTMVKFKKEVTERKRLHNELLDMRGAIRVFCRVRPMSTKDLSAGRKSCITVPDETNVVVGTEKFFSFDQVFGPESSQEQVFNETQPLIVSVLDGYNVCIFAYGQTGSGKTHTMEGSRGNPGVNLRTLESLFEIAAERTMMFEYEIKVSMMEIYNETIRDLAGHDNKQLDVKQSAEGRSYVPDLTTVQVTSMDQVLSLMETGKKNRHSAATNMNEHSSRSHMILSIYVTAKNLMTGARSNGKLHLIDLAGSERLSKSGAQGDRLTEAKNINKSLSALGDVVAALVSKKGHVPYRNSKLTFFLQDSLGGDSKVMMVVQCSPSDSDMQETVCSLNFASRVRNVELGQAKSHKSDIKASMQLKEREGEIDKLRERLKASEEANAKAQAQLQKLSSTSAAAAESSELAASRAWVIQDLEVRLTDTEAANQMLEQKLREAEANIRRLQETSERSASAALPCPLNPPPPHPTSALEAIEAPPLGTHNWQSRGPGAMRRSSSSVSRSSNDVLDQPGKENQTNQSPAPGPRSATTAVAWAAPADSHRHTLAASTATSGVVGGVFGGEAGGSSIEERLNNYRLLKAKQREHLEASAADHDHAPSVAPMPRSALKRTHTHVAGGPFTTDEGSPTKRGVPERGVSAKRAGRLNHSVSTPRNRAGGLGAPARVETRRLADKDKVNQSMDLTGTKPRRAATGGWR